MSSITLMSGALLVGQLVMLVLSCRQPPAVKGTVRWSSVQHVYFIMSSVAYCRGYCRLTPRLPLALPRLGQRTRCSGVGGLTIIGPINTND
ncbi:hypothetical protein BHE74_00034634 [Ensete ventricosum]|nr:hypothetical protein BHE74_00034634 [Ensete ventricosum]RZR91235.1 hypothetical protein BHM03_00019326 [Ensete ventricosum]